VIITTVRRVSIISAIFINLFAVSAYAKGNSMKDTPIPPNHQCDYVNFYHNEAKNPKGPGKCDSDCDCDGTRSCDVANGVCAGAARPEKLTAAVCNSKDYHYNEAWTKAGPGKCSGDCECDGLRTCESGKCAGTAR
jgi:hypothetical protein